MKRLLIILSFVFSYLLTHAQSHNDSTRYTWYKNQYGVRYPRGMFDSALQIPYQDTTLVKGGRVGAINAHTGDNSFYMWDGIGWRGISGGGGSTPTWDEVLNVGATNFGKTLLFDTAYTIADGDAASHVAMQFKPIRQDGAPSFYWNFGAQRYSGVSRADNVMNWGWNLNGGGGAAEAGEVGIGFQLEQWYIPVPGDTNTEAHLFYIDKNGVQHRLYSYTIKEYLGSVTYYQTVGTFDLRRYDNDSIWFALQYNSISMSYLGSRMEFTGDLNGWQISKTGFHDYDGSYYGDRFMFSNFKSLKAPGQIDIGGGIGSHNVSATIQFEDSLETLLGTITAYADHFIVASQNGTNNPVQIQPGNGQSVDFYNDKMQAFVPAIFYQSPGTPVARIDARETTGLEAALALDQNSGGIGTGWAAEITSRGGNDHNVGIYLAAFNGAVDNKALTIFLPNDGPGNWIGYHPANAPWFQVGWMKIGYGDVIDRPDQALHVNGFFHLDSLRSAQATDSIVMWNRASGTFSMKEAPSAIALPDTFSLQSGVNGIRSVGFDSTAMLPTGLAFVAKIVADGAVVSDGNIVSFVYAAPIGSGFSVAITPADQNTAGRCKSYYATISDASTFDIGINFESGHPLANEVYLFNVIVTPTGR